MKMNMKIKIVCLTIIGVLMMSFMMSNPLYADVDVTTGLPSDEITQQEIEPLIEAANGANILWDTYHGVYLSYSPSGWFSGLKSLLEGKGYTVDENNAGILKLNLSNYDIIVICLGSAWNSPYSGAEVTAILNYVGNGGRLLIMGDNPNTPNNNINVISQNIGTALGISDITPADAYITNLTSHSIFSGVSEIYMRAAGEIYAIPPSSVEAWTDDQKPAVTTAEPGSGRVVVLGDFNMMDNNYIAISDNQLFSENVFDWLAESTWPAVYSTLFGSSSSLALFRQYRDEILLSTTKGVIYKTALYAFSNQALQVLLHNPKLIYQAKALIEPNYGAVLDVVDGYKGVINNTDEIAAFLDAYAKKSPLILKIFSYVVRWDMLRKQKQGDLFFGFRLE